VDRIAVFFLLIENARTRKLTRMYFKNIAKMFELSVTVKKKKITIGWLLVTSVFMSTIIHLHRKMLTGVKNVNAINVKPFLI